MRQDLIERHDTVSVSLERLISLIRRFDAWIWYLLDQDRGPDPITVLVAGVPALEAFGRVLLGLFTPVMPVVMGIISCAVPAHEGDQIFLVRDIADEYLGNIAIDKLAPVGLLYNKAAAFIRRLVRLMLNHVRIENAHVGMILQYKTEKIQTHVSSPGSIYVLKKSSNTRMVRSSSQ
jgi:hypothetical protein